MRPAPFALEMPQDLSEALSLRADRGDEALVLAGGQTLIPLLNMRIARPDRIIDLGGIDSLRSITRSDGEVIIGAMTRQEEVEISPLVAQTCPLLGHAAAFVGQPQTRSRGTLGGSLALGSAFSELCVCLLALDGQVRVESTRGARWIDGPDLFEDYLCTTLAEDEILTQACFREIDSDTRWGFSELKFRGCDFPIVIAAAILAFNGETCVGARIAVGGAASTPIRVEAAEAVLVGRWVDEEAIRDASALAERFADPMDDLHAPAGYRKRATAVQVAQALRMAVSRKAHQ
jgi:CO/xanthine dehydrogenase FAD-binding subunit